MKKGYIYSIIGAILFGTAGLFIKSAYNTGLDSISMLTLQYTIAIIIMFAVGFVIDRKMFNIRWKQIINLAVLGIIGNTFMTVFYYKAFAYLPVAMVTMLLYTYPIMVFLYSLIFKTTKLNYKKFLALILAFLGCNLSLNIFSAGFTYSTIGIIFGLLAAFFYAFMNLYTERKIEDSVHPLAISAYSTLFSWISLIIYKFPVEIIKGKFSYEGLFYVVMLALFCEIIPLTLIYSAINIVGALKVSIIGNLEIPSAIVISYVLLGEKITIVQAIGVVITIYAVRLIQSD